MRYVILALLLLAMPAYPQEIIESQILQDCNIEGKTLRYVKIVNCQVTDSEIYSAEIIDSTITYSNVHEVDAKSTDFENCILKNVYTTEGSTVRNCEIHTSTIEGTYIEHSSGSQVTFREGDIEESNFSQTNVQNASITDSELDEYSTTQSVDIRTTGSVDADADADAEAHSEASSTENESKMNNEPIVIYDPDELESHSEPPETESKEGFWKRFFCTMWLFNRFLTC